MKLVKLSLIAALLVGSSVYAEEKSDLGVSANMAITSDYIWRGMSQTQNAPAFQGGIDLEYKGFYLGTWGSNVNFGDGENSLEADLYAGYASEIAGIGFDIGFIQFAYPKMTDEYNFGEVYFGLSKDFEVVAVGAKYYYGIDTNDVTDSTNDWEPSNTWEVTASVALPYEIAFDATYGDYTDVGSYYSAGITRAVDKFDVTLAYTGFINADSAGEDQSNLVGTISTSF